MAFHQNKPITIGMVGGGPDSGIGETHRIAQTAFRTRPAGGPVEDSVIRKVTSKRSLTSIQNWRTLLVPKGQAVTPWASRSL
jgi:hypothetical protein